MSFIKESYLAYKKVQEVLEKETSDHEISMARSELEGIADKATATSSMLEGMTESGNPLPAWVQSKITNASDYITSVHDYIKYNPQINESVSLEETTFEKIYQMQQDGKSVEDIAKELNLKADLVKKVLGESKVISEGLSDAQISQLKKEYEPLKGKTITTSQYQQLKNILFKLQDGDLEKLQKQNIPFASTGAGSILRVRKSFSHLGTKITNVKVPGLEGMAEEEVKETFKDNIVKKLVKPIQDFNKKKEEPKKEEVEVIESHFEIGQHVIYHGPKNPLTPIKAQIIGVATPQTGAYYQIKKSDGETTYAAPDQMKLVEGNEVNNYIKSLKDSIQNLENKLSKLDKSKPDAEQRNLKDKIKLAKDNLDIMAKKQATKQEEIENLQDACWTGYKQVGLKKKGKRMVPNCVKEDKRLYIESIVAVKNKAEKSGMPYPILKQVYDRGMAAWKGGHRPGATQVQWALARVNSFVTKSSGTWGGADSDLAKKVKG